MMGGNPGLLTPVKLSSLIFKNDPYKGAISKSRRERGESNNLQEAERRSSILGMNEGSMIISEEVDDKLQY